MLVSVNELPIHSEEDVGGERAHRRYTREAKKSPMLR